MTPRINAYGPAEITATRHDDEHGSLSLTIRCDDGTEVVIGAGAYHDDAYELEKMLRGAADEAKAILDDWRDVPDETDGFVFFDSRDGYIVQLEGLHWNGDKLLRIDRFPNAEYRTFPTRDIATYQLAAAMSASGVFPNAWYQDERGWSEDIGRDVRRFHDAGGDGLLPLEGVEYEPGASIAVDDLSAYVVRDYGTLGIVFVLSGDDREAYREHSDRHLITPLDDDSDDDR